MAQIIMGQYVVYTYAVRPIKNQEALEDQFNDPASAFLWAGFYATDTFFWIAGVLSGYLLLEKVAQSRGEMPWGWYGHRIWRLWPAYAFALFVSWAVAPYMGTGPIWYSVTGVFEDCGDYWWTNLLALNNFLPSGAGSACLPGSWYLASLIQFLLITPPIVYLYYRYSQPAGWGILGGLVTLQMVVAWAVAGTGGYNLVPFARGNQGLIEQITIKPYTRVAAYALGLGIGWVVYSHRQQKEAHDSAAVTASLGIVQDRVVRYGMGGVGLALITFVTFVQTSAYADVRNGWTAWSSWENAIFLGVDHALFSVGLSCLLLPALLGKFRGISGLLRAHIWTPLARLTYSTYLASLTLVPSYVYASDSSLFWDSSTLALDILAMVIMCYAVGYLLAMLVEAPLRRLEKVLGSKGDRLIPEGDK